MPHEVDGQPPRMAIVILVHMGLCWLRHSKRIQKWDRLLHPGSAGDQDGRSLREVVWKNRYLVMVPDQFLLGEHYLSNQQGPKVLDVLDCLECLSC